MKTSGNTIFITGGGSGIGLSLAKTLLAEKNTVIIAGRNIEKLNKACADNSGLIPMQCDVTNDEQIKEVVAKCEADYGGINILINNAGIFQLVNYNGGDPMPTIEHQLKEIDIDFSGPIRMVHYFLPQLRKQKGEVAIVNVSSGLAFVPLSIAPIYCGTKAGIHSWTRSLRLQLKNTKVKVFELMPPLVDTPMIDQEFKDRDFKMIQPEQLSEAFMKGLAKDKYQITPGQSGQLSFMSRYAPKFIFKALNKAFNYS